MKTRIETDSMGEMEVPADKLYGAQTARAVENFPISGTGIGNEMISALGLIKKAAARTNAFLKKLDEKQARVIEEAAGEVAVGTLDEHFPVDVFQTGSGTSSNMNANEVIANRANQLLGEGGPMVHPNDHVNMGQSSNDVFPTAIHVAALVGIEKRLLPALEKLESTLADKASEFDSIVKIGRTHLQDATPITLGQEFSGFAAQIANGIAHIESATGGLRELPIGGTAVGTGINTKRSFGGMMAREISTETGTSFTEARNHFEAQAARDGAVRMSGALKSLAISLVKISNDIRWLGSGPRMGLSELKLPPVQPGSSIMPGKVNPVIAEAVIQAATQVVGNDAAIGMGGAMSQLQLNTMQPLIARNLLEQIHLLTRACHVFEEKLIADIAPNLETLQIGVERSLSMATALTPHVGYDKAAEVAKRAEATGKTVREVALEMGLFEKDELDKILEPITQTRPD